MVTLTSQSRRSGAEPTSTQITSLTELDNIDIFDFFNVPHVSEASISPHHDSQGASRQTGVIGLPDPEADWLRYGTPYT